MDKIALVALAKKIVDGTATEDELFRYNAYCNELQEQPEQWEGMDMELPILRSASLSKFWDYQQLATKKSILLWRRAISAAAAIAIIVLGGYFFVTSRYFHPSLSSENLGIGNDIVPGKNGATLTLSSGRVIQLSENKKGVIIHPTFFMYEDKTAISQSASEGSGTLIAKTAKGQTYQITLPDGSKVWLNAMSSIKFPSSFTGNERQIEMIGEVYLEVAKDAKHPFIVQSRDQQVEVLGTHFNISAYSDESTTKTTLLEGSVRVGTLLSMSREASKRERDGSKVLKPGQQSVLTGNNQIKVQEINGEEAIAWKKGLFVFENEHIRDVMNKITRWYDISVKYGSGIENARIGGIISRYENVSQVIEMINSTKAVSCKLENRVIVVNQYKNNK